MRSTFARLGALAAGVVIGAGCQTEAPDGDPVAARVAPPTATLGSDKQVDTPVPGFRFGEPHGVRVHWDEYYRNVFSWTVRRPTAGGSLVDVYGTVLESRRNATPGGLRFSDAPGDYRAVTPFGNRNDGGVGWCAPGRRFAAHMRLGTQMFSTTSNATADPCVEPVEPPAEAFANHGGRWLRVWIEPGGARVMGERHIGGVFVISDGAGDKSDVDAEWGRHVYVVSWRTGDDLYTTRIGEFPSEGTVLDTHLEGSTVVGGVQLPTGPGVQSEPKLACADRKTVGLFSSCLILYRDDRDAATNGLDLYAYRYQVEPTLVLPGIEVPVVVGPGDPRGHTISHGYGEWYLGWEADAGGAPHLYTTNVEEDGTPSGEVQQLDGATTNNAEREAAVATAADGELVVWTDERAPGSDIVGQRYAPNGSKRDPTAFPIGAAAGEQLEPAVVHDGADYVVAWSDVRAVPGQIRFTPVADGIPLTTDGVVAAAGAGFQSHPALASDELGTTLVVWEDRRDAGGVAIVDVTGDQRAPDLATRGGPIQLVWEDHRADPPQVFGSRLVAAGGLAATTPAGALIQGNAVRPQASALEADVMVVGWLDPSATPTPAVRLISADGDLGPVLPAAGKAMPQAALALPTYNAIAFRVPVIHVGHVYATDVTRVFRRVLSTERTLGDVCSNASQCDTGFCVDGVCCESACGGTTNFDCQACAVVKGSSVDGLCELVTDGRVCRKNADPFCDTREVCDGSAGAACPADVGQHAGDACTAACGAGVCPPADETGAPHACDCP